MGSVPGAVEERGDERRDLWELLLEGEVAGVEQVQLGVGQIP
jgi:hypothetical protein